MLMIYNEFSLSKLMEMGEKGCKFLVEDGEIKSISWEESNGREKNVR